MCKLQAYKKKKLVIRFNLSAHHLEPIKREKVLYMGYTQRIIFQTSIKEGTALMFPYILTLFIFIDGSEL